MTDLWGDDKVSKRNKARWHCFPLIMTDRNPGCDEWAQVTLLSLNAHACVKKSCICLPELIHFNLIIYFLICKLKHASNIHVAFFLMLTYIYHSWTIIYRDLCDTLILSHEDDLMQNYWFLYNFIHLWVCVYVCVSVCHGLVHVEDRRSLTPWNRVTDDWELNSGLLQGQPALFMTEPSLQIFLLPLWLTICIYLLYYTGNIYNMDM